MTPGRPHPEPVRTADNHGFWDAADDGRLAVQRCAGCRAWYHPPRPMCPACGSLDLRWTDVPGTGVVYSYTLLHHPQHPAFDYPVIAVVVELDEGVRLVSNLIGVAAAEVRIGLPVELRFAPTVAGGQVPVFTVAGAAQR